MPVEQALQKTRNCFVFSCLSVPGAAEVYLGSRITMPGSLRKRSERAQPPVSFVTERSARLAIAAFSTVIRELWRYFRPTRKTNSRKASQGSQKTEGKLNFTPS